MFFTIGRGYHVGMRTTTKKVWEGKSPYDGGNIVAAISNGSTNVKTGDLDTLWILSADEEPHKAVKSGADASVCGDCPHRREHGSLGDCYVLPFQAPLSVHRSLSGAPGRKREALRLGGYGDPAMLPEALVATMVATYATSLGYTHQWKRRWASWSKRFCMASVDSIAEAKKAWSKGWRTFRVSYDGAMEPNEILCPSVTHGVLCKDCNLCSGSTGAKDKRKNIVIMAHGTKSGGLLKV